MFNVRELETYLLQPRDLYDLDLLIGAIGPPVLESWLSLVIGLRSGMAPPEACNGLMVPIVAFDQIYTFDQKTLIQAIPRPETMTKQQLLPAAEELFAHLMQLTDSAGATDEHRGINYLAMRYLTVYASSTQQFACDFSLCAFDVQPSSLGTTRKSVEVIFSYRNRNTDFGEKYCVRVDVTEEFPFLVTKLSPYYDR